MMSVTCTFLRTGQKPNKLRNVRARAFAGLHARRAGTVCEETT
eukprot:COSAG06_NODE_6525_length_2894_cov_4.797862_2_plen_43_part_00